MTSFVTFNRALSDGLLEFSPNPCNFLDNMVSFFEIANKGSDAGQSSQKTSHRNRQFNSFSAFNISQQPFSSQGIMQLEIVRFRIPSHLSRLLYAFSNSFSNDSASCCVSILRRSFKNVNSRRPLRISRFSVLVQTGRFGRGGEMFNALLLLLLVVTTTTPPIHAANAMRLAIDTVTVVTVVDVLAPATTAAAPLAFKPAAHDAEAF